MVKPKQVAKKALELERGWTTATQKKTRVKNKDAQRLAKTKVATTEAHGVGRTGTMLFESAVRVLHRQTNPGLTISQACVAQINGMLVHVCELLVGAAVDNARLAKVCTLASNHVLRAAEVSLPLELAARAVEGAEAARSCYDESGDAK